MGSYYHDGELYHWGVKGMKWGVRRYQNKDGSLTPLGKKRAEEGANLFPKYKGKRLGWKSKRSLHRDTVAENITNKIMADEHKEYEDYIKSHPKFNSKEYDAREIWRGTLRDKNQVAAKKKAYIKQFVEDYADATLKDLGMDVTPESKKFVMDLLRKNEAHRGLI